MRSVLRIGPRSVRSVPVTHCFYMRSVLRSVRAASSPIRSAAPLEARLRA
jgi:hypothetical protein